MQHHVPQFLEVEDKLFVFLTLKQFLYILGGAGASYLAFHYLHWILYIPIICAIVALSFSLAFLEINKMPFINIVSFFLLYFFTPRLYIWEKIPKKIDKKSNSEDRQQPQMYIPPISKNKLKDLAWSLDIKENAVTDDIIHKHTAPLLKDI